MLRPGTVGLRETVFSEKGPLRFTREYAYNETEENGTREAILDEVAKEVADLFGAFLELDAHTSEVVQSFRNDYRTVNSLWVNTDEEKREERLDGFTILPWVNNPSLGLSEETVLSFKKSLVEDIKFQPAKHKSFKIKTYSTKNGAVGQLAELLKKAGASYLDEYAVFPTQSEVKVYEMPSSRTFHVNVNFGDNKKL